jgi:hypothetical protein
MMTAQLLRLVPYFPYITFFGKYTTCEKPILSHSVILVSRDSAEKKCNQTITGPTYGADYVLEILGQKWGALPNFLALRNRQNLVLGKNNQVSLTIDQILGTAAENTGWLLGPSSDLLPNH